MVPHLLAHWTPDAASPSQHTKAMSSVLSYTNNHVQRPTHGKLTFLTLPQKIRFYIYTYLLVDDYPVEWPAARGPAIHPAIVRTCSFLYLEGYPQLYKYNVFSFAHPSDITVFSHLFCGFRREDVWDHMSEMIFRVRDRDMRLWYQYAMSKDPMRCMKRDCRHINKLKVIVQQTWWIASMSPEENMRGWQERSRIKQLCMALQAREIPKVQVVVQIRVPAPHFDYLVRHYVAPMQPNATTLALQEDMRLQSLPVMLFTNKVILELIAHPPPQRTVPKAIPIGIQQWCRQKAALCHELKNDWRIAINSNDVGKR